MNTETATPKIDYRAKARNAHFRALESLCRKPHPVVGNVLYRQLRRAECTLSRVAEALCSRPMPEGTWERAVKTAGDSVRRILGALPTGIHFNGDPRGFALKLDTDRGAVLPDGMHRDMGGYGILAPDSL